MPFWGPEKGTHAADKQGAVKLFHFICCHTVNQLGTLKEKSETEGILAWGIACAPQSGFFNSCGLRSLSLSLIN